MRRQDVEAMLAATNRVPVSSGDTLLCPAGTPHAIGDGILLVELQEPTDLSVILEWHGFPLDPGDVTLGLPLEAALACVNRRACSLERVRALRGRPLNGAAGPLLPSEADPFFVAERVVGDSLLPTGYSVLIVTEGTGTVSAETGPPVPVARGSTVLIPHAAGVCSLSGGFTGIRCLPAYLRWAQRALNVLGCSAGAALTWRRSHFKRAATAIRERTASGTSPSKP